MPTFTTPSPIAVTMNVGNGKVRLVATDRTDTVVEVVPAGSGAAEAAVAAETTVEFAGGELTITAPKTHGFSGLGKGTPVRVVVELPTGSSVHLTGVHAEVRAEGALGLVFARTNSGLIDLDQVASLQVETSSANVAAGHVTGAADVRGSSAKLEINRVDGPLRLRNSIGDVLIDEAGADVDISTSSGRISVGRAAGNLTVKNANGGISVGELSTGEAHLSTARGSVEIGIAQGTAALIDARSTLGTVKNALTVQDGPGAFAREVRVQARTWSGNVIVQRAA